MASLAVVPVAGSVCFRSRKSAVQSVGNNGNSAPTTVRVRELSDPTVRQLMTSWEDGRPDLAEFLLPTSAAVREFKVTVLVDGHTVVSNLIEWTEAAPEAEDAFGGSFPVLAAVAKLEKMLGVPVRDVLAAAKISPRTYYYWKARGIKQPRLGSHGRLWELSRTMEELQDDLSEPLAIWLRSDVRRLKALRAGDLQALLLASTPRSEAADGVESVRQLREMIGDESADEVSLPPVWASGRRSPNRVRVQRAPLRGDDLSE